MKTPHTSTRRGQRVKLVMRDKSEVIGKFVDRTGQFIVVEIDGRAKRIEGRNLKAFIIIKGNPSE